jgi:DNA helicase HerA-like ATPase
VQDTVHMSSLSANSDGVEKRAEGANVLGHVVACTGGKAILLAKADPSKPDLMQQWTVGKMVSIDLGQTRVAALAYAMKAASNTQVPEIMIDVDILGEIYRRDDGSEHFTTGLSAYPYMGAPVRAMDSNDLSRIYDKTNDKPTVVGTLSQDSDVAAKVSIGQMLSKHFAVVGSTGTGKSTSVSLLLHKAVEADPKLRVLILDPHNEFAAAFPTLSVVIDTDRLDLPFWLMRLEELVEVIFRGRVPVADEVDLLREIIPEAKKAFKGTDQAAMRKSFERASITADTPVPYRIADVIAAIDERIGKLDGRSEKPYLKQLRARILAALTDPRYAFMFSNTTISDNAMETVAHIFRVPGEGKPISVFQLSGIPSEVVNSVVSVLCRMAFELALWSGGALHTLVVCEEAHRYIPADHSLGFIPTRQAIARIAKEGRKYGVSLGIITQRPGELDQTILSQCSTVFAMRLTNENDQQIVKTAIPNSSGSTVNFLSSLGNGEAIAFGEAISVPMRMKFTRLKEIELPRASGLMSHAESGSDNVDLRSIVMRMRSTSGPNISNFQQSYDAMLGDEFLPKELPPKWNDAPEVFDDLRPYRPEMLSTINNAQRQPSSAAPTSDSNQTAKDELMRRSLGDVFKR